MTSEESQGRVPWLNSRLVAPLGSLGLVRRLLLLLLLFLELLLDQLSCDLECQGWN